MKERGIRTRKDVKAQRKRNEADLETSRKREGGRDWEGCGK
jgi:hypothetical protein